MPPPRELPGFYYDAEKNRYFPVKPYCCPNQSKSQLGKQAPLEEKIESEIIPDVDNNALQILFDREIGNPHRASAFQKEYMKIKAHKPRIWSYGPTSCADGAVEEIITCIQTEEGLKRANIIVWGDSKGFLGVSEVFRPGFTDDRSPIEEPKCIFPCSQELTSVSAYLPPCLAPVHLSRKSSSKITAIKKLKTINEVDNESLMYPCLFAARFFHFYPGPLGP